MKLIKIDKNGTKYYSDCTCKRCGGVGWLPYRIDGGRCFECCGFGVSKERIYKEYTPEYEAKLAERRAKRAEAKRLELVAKADEANKEFFQKQGFNENGKTYVVLGNTFKVKEQLKQLGCKWNNALGWHSPVKFEGFEFVEIDVDDVYFKDYTETYRWNQLHRNGDETYSTKIQEANAMLNRNTSNSVHIGNVGDKIEIEVKLERTNKFESQFGTTYIYNFKDSNGNILVWKTKNFFDVESCTIKGTVKEHSEYKGINQTVLTRCKITQRKEV